MSRKDLAKEVTTRSAKLLHLQKEGDKNEEGGDENEVEVEGGDDREEKEAEINLDNS